MKLCGIYLAILSLPMMCKAATLDRHDIVVTQNETVKAANVSSILHTAVVREGLHPFTSGKRISGKNTQKNDIEQTKPANYQRKIVSMTFTQGKVSTARQEDADVNSRAADGSTLLHLAVANNMMGSVKFLLQSPYIFMSLKNSNNTTPLMLAENLNLQEIGSVLRNKIGDVSLPRLLQAIEDESLEDVRSLVHRGADVNANYTDNWSPLHYAARLADIRFVQYLVDVGGADINIKGPYQRTPLFEAAFYGNLETLKHLIYRGADVNYVCYYNYVPTTAMRAAYMNGHSDVVNYLSSIGGKM